MRVVDVVPLDILEWESSKEPRKPQAQVPLEFATVDERTVGPLREIVPHALYRHTPAFLGRGDVGFAAISEGRFGGWVWLSRRSHRDPWSGLTYRLAPDEAYGYALWVPPDLRTQGVPRALMIRMLQNVYADPALSRMYASADKRNRESQMLLRLLGFKDVQEVTRVRVLGRVGRRLPRSDRPRFGPVSVHGRHSAALQDPPAPADSGQT
jgi:RimJ/RimL family protein N-acetyltransferase